MDLTATRRGRRVLFGVLYLCEGAPIGFLWWALPVILRERGMPLDRIGVLLATLALPWVLKFAWAPVVDLLRGPRWTSRGWIVSSQCMMLATLLPLLRPGSLDSLDWLLPLLVLHAVAAATQDVAIDGLCIRSVPAGERGSLNGWMQAGMLTGRAAFGGGALLLRPTFGDTGVVAALVALIAATTLAGLFFRDRTSAAQPGRGAEWLRQARLALRTPTTWLALAWASLAGAAFEGVGAFAGPMLVDLGVDSRQVGIFFALPSVLAMVTGALLGGWISDRLPRRRAVALLGGCMTACVLALALLLRAAPGPTLLLGLLSGVYLSIGLFTAASYALLMDLTSPRLGSTQFSAYMGATNLCESWSARATGSLVVRGGYPFAFATMAVVSLAAALLLVWMRVPAGGSESAADPPD